MQASVQDVPTIGKGIPIIGGGAPQRDGVKTHPRDFKCSRKGCEKKPKWAPVVSFPVPSKDGASEGGEREWESRTLPYMICSKCKAQFKKTLKKWLVEAYEKSPEPELGKQGKVKFVKGALLGQQPAMPLELPDGISDEMSDMRGTDAGQEGKVQV